MKVRIVHKSSPVNSALPGNNPRTPLAGWETVRITQNTLLAN